MGTEEEKGGGGGGARVVPAAGTIVWVRRRNGSWWPGRILDPEELPASQLMSPRSGTPVKLLGREDASVDWYNLEKSKRVKAFRCGEFDACIGRAEAALGFPIKKREKYARREDAILHALELERQQKQGILSNYPSNKASGSLGSELNNFSSEIYVRNFEPGVHSKLSRDKSQTPSQKAALSLEEENMGGSLYAYNGKDAKQFRLKYGGPEAGPRMRGLQDFGLRTASSKRKTISWETSEKLGDNIAADYPGEGPLMRSASYDGGSKSLFSLTKKRSSGGIFEDSLGKRRDRRRPLVQVLQNSAKIPPSLSVQSDYDGGSITVEGATDLMGVLRPRKKSRYVYLPGSIDDSVDNHGYPPEQMASTSRQFELDSFGDEYTSSGLIESDCSDFSKGNYIEPDAEEANLFMGMEELEAGSKDSRRHVSYDSSSYEIPDELEKTKTDEMAIAACIPQLSPHEQSADGSAEIGISKWHMKGKRNVRNIGKRSMDAVDGNKTFTGVNRSDGFSIEMAYENKRSSFNVGKMSIFSQNSSGRGFYHKKEDFSYDDDMIGDNHMFGHGDTRYSSFLKAGKHHQRKHSSFHDSDNYSHVISLSRWEADGPSHTAHRAYWMESEECFDPVFANDLSGELGPMLVDVDLKVQAASYRGERVPLVSLMSRLNGKAIVGHPIQIEILEDGSTALLVCRNDSFLEESTAPPRVWKTARRTIMQRIPRSNPGASALDGDDAEHLPYPGIESKPLIKKPHSGHLDHHARLSKRGHFHIQQSMSGFQMELRKRINLSSQKIRMLSSIAIRHKLGGENVDVKLARGGSILSGLIKPERTLPLVACVPLKVAFSRILEALGRPSSAVAHRVRMSSSAIRNPS